MRNIAAILLLLSVAFLGGCHSIGADTVTQVSTIDALLAGSYDGQMPCAALAKFGGFGIGTFDRLDGEMILLDGEFYQVRADGKVYRPSGRVTTPFACVVAFEPQIDLPLPFRLDYDSLKSAIDSAVNENAFCAVRVDGRFKRIQVRSVPAQDKPYPPLVEVTKNQAVFDYADIEGTLVGFRCPPFAKGVNVPGYHLHFISTDRSKGGHLLSFDLDGPASARIDLCHKFYMILPDDPSLGDIDFTLDRSAQLHKAEEVDPGARQ
ncbi:acetolactate decarboxylase [Candidatus Sumerlaeota bacterium]|nr:acetolactate decarboxylase [Candidatus Sumerlaeota bacterium]